MAPTFYFQIETISSKKVHIARRSTQDKHTRQPPRKSGQAEKQTPNFLIHTGLNLRKLEGPLGNFKHQTSVLSGPISQTTYPRVGWRWGGGRERNAGGFKLVICLCFKKKNHILWILTAVLRLVFSTNYSFDYMGIEFGLRAPFLQECPNDCWAVHITNRDLG